MIKDDSSDFWKHLHGAREALDADLAETPEQRVRVHGNRQRLTGMLKVASSFLPKSPVPTARERVYYHGGPKGLKPGDWILPPSKTGARSQLGDDGIAVKVSHPDRLNSVYVTTNPLVAVEFAVRRGRERDGCVGQLYTVRPEGVISDDLEASGPGTEFYCPSARVLTATTPNLLLIELASIGDEMWHRRNPQFGEIRRIVYRAIVDFPKLNHYAIPGHVLDIIDRLHREDRAWELVKYNPIPEVVQLMNFATEHPEAFTLVPGGAEDYGTGTGFSLSHCLNATRRSS